MIGKTLAHYKILERVGRGGMGEVYRALDTKLNREVALKVLPPELASQPDRRKRFEREAMTVASLKHPNIVTLHSVEEADGVRFLTMELVEGRTLVEEIGTNGVSLERFFELAVPLTDAVAAAHAKGITHRDLKPENIMVDGERRLKVLDFGLAKLLDRAPHDEEATLPADGTEAGKVMGTVAYMSPEQAEGKPVDTRSDVFSLGILFYEMLTGERPFAGETRVSTITSILRDNPRPLTERRAELPHHLGRIVNRCMAKSPDRRFQSVLDLRNDLRDLAEEISRSGTSPIFSDRDSSSIGGGGAMVESRATRRNRLRVLLPAALLALGVILILVLKPFGFRFEGDQPVAAAENTIAVMYFENMTQPEDPKRLGEILSNLLITDLSESQSIRVLSHQRLYDLLRQQGKEGLKRIDQATATDVARQAGAKWMLLGSLLQTEPNLIVTSQLVDAGDGTVVSSQRVEGNEKESVFAVAERLAGEIREDLSLPGATTSMARAMDASTGTEEAYRFYLAAREAENRYDKPQAIQLYRQAIETDSTFAMAYCRLAVPSVTPAFPKGKQYAAAASRHIQKASDRDRYIIRSLEHYYDHDWVRSQAEFESLLKRYPDDKEALLLYAGALLGHDQNEEAARHLERIIQIDPMEKVAYNMLAYVYENLGNSDKSIWAINQYIRIAPEEPNPYDSRGDLYAYAGRLDDAISSYKMALEKTPDYFASKLNLFLMYLFKRDYRTAEMYLGQVTPQNGIPDASTLRFLRALPLVYQGRMEEAVELLDQGIAADRIDGDQGIYFLEKFALKIEILETLGRIEAARRVACEDAPSIADPDFQLPWYMDDYCVWLSARIGAFEKAEKRVEQINQSLTLHPDELSEIYSIALGMLARGRGDYGGAIKHFEPIYDDPSEFWEGTFLGELYIQAGRLSDAVEILEHLHHRYSRYRGTTPMSSVRIHYLLGQAYEASGWNEKAAELYTEFLEFWKDGDPGIPDVADAEERLARLRQGS